MGYPHKTTPEKLDRIIQVIWHFKSLHGETETPSTTLIANELDIHSSGVAHYIHKLEEQGRLDRIQVRPMKVRLLDHPMNKRAIKLFQRELEKAHKPLDIKPSPQPTPQPDSDVIVVDTPAEVLRETAEKMSAAINEPAPTLQGAVREREERRQTEAPAIEQRGEDTIVRLSNLPPVRNMNWNEAALLLRAHGGDLEAIARPYILNTARPGELLEQLLDRGYTVHKTNPRWRD